MAERIAPFGALIAASSFIAAILYVAGFAFRWSYYYNFGVQHLVYDLSVPVILMTAIELIRTPAHLLVFVLWVVLPLIAVSLAIELVRRAARRSRPIVVRRVAGVVVDTLRLDTPLVVDAILAAVLVYTTYMAGADIGYTTFKAHIVDAPDHPLPAVTVVFERGADGKLPALACAAPPDTAPLVGSARALDQIQTFHRTCTTADGTWRLLFRTKESLFLFASEPPRAEPKTTRPLTLVLPVTPAIHLVME
jgi:hypothetical protein